MRYSLSTILLLAACASGPRTSTLEERTIAHTVITSVDSAVTVAAAAHKVTPEKAALAQEQLRRLRDAVVASETKPVTFSDLLNEITLIAVEWLAKPAK